MHQVPENLLYSPSHTWLEAINAQEYRIGITDFAQAELGDIVYFEPPKLNTHYAAAAICAIVESVKSTSDIYCPISGTITDINQALAEQPEHINSAPYQHGWLFTITAANDTDINQLINAAAYAALTKQE